jgi:hypothetical protein
VWCLFYLTIAPESMAEMINEELNIAKLGMAGMTLPKVLILGVH